MAAATLLGACAKPASAPPTPSPSPPPTPSVADPLDGARVPPDSVRHRIAAIVVDNYPDARPQSGLHDADIVYEVEAEGGITRYLALFLGTPASEIGPVRSARTYVVDLAHPYDPYFAHAGQNDDVIDVLRELRAGGFPDMDEIQQTPAAFWRDNTRDMPHNLYTSIVRIRDVGPKSGYADKPFDARAFLFDGGELTGPAAASPPADAGSSPGPGRPELGPSPAVGHPPLVPETVVTFWNDYDVHFVWDGAAYERFIDGQAQHDRDDDRPYEISDIVAVWIPATVLDKIGDLAMNVYGSFPALLIRAGNVTTGRWDATGPSALPVLVGDDGRLLSLAPGQIYIEIMPQGSTVTNGKKSWSH